MLYHSGEGSGFARARRTCYKHQSAALFGKVKQNRGHFKLLERGYLGVEQTDTASEPAALTEHVNALPCAVFQLKGEVYVVAFGELLFLLGGENGENGAVYYLVGKLGVLAQLAVHAHNCRQPDGKMNVRGVHFARLHDKFFKSHDLCPFAYFILN